ncbi:MAG: hypothetical protein EA359_07860 [Balneolaceae bacterium]|nr:MAG: hypothetical protein EA359_07860 [Balneolaceae bacterium]
MYSGKILTILFTLLIWQTTHLHAQNNNDDEPNRLSLGIMGNVAKGHMGTSSFQSGVAGAFEFQDQFNTNLGFNIRYVISPEIALQSNIVYGRFTILSDFFDQDLLSFENNYLTTSITTQLSLLRLFGATSSNFNIYGSFGTGLMFNNVSIESDRPEINQSSVSAKDHPFTSFFTTFGGGVRFNLGPRIDSFAQYEYISSSRDIIDGNFVGELLNLGGAAQSSRSWSAVSVGIQFKFGGSSRDADWHVPSRAPALPTLGDRDVLRELEEALIARQDELFAEEVRSLRSLIDSLEAQRLSEEEARNALVEHYANTLNEFQSRIAALEEELARERGRADANATEIESLSSIIRSLQDELAAQEQARVQQEEQYAASIRELQSEIDSLERDLERAIDGRDISDLLRPDEPETIVDPADPDYQARMQPELEGRKETDPLTDIADLPTTEEPLDEDEQDTTIIVDVPRTVAQEPETDLLEEPEMEEIEPDDDREEDRPIVEDFYTDDRVEREERAAIDEISPEDTELAEELTPDERAVTEEPMLDPEDAEADEADRRSPLWLIYVILALVAAGIIYYVAKAFSPKSGVKKSGTGAGTAAATGAVAAGAVKEEDNDQNIEEVVIPKVESKAKPSYTVPEHSVVLEPKRPKQKEPIAPKVEEIPDESKKSRADKNGRNSSSVFAFFSMAATEVSDFFGDLFSSKSKKK